MTSAEYDKKFDSCYDIVQEMREFSAKQGFFLLTGNNAMIGLWKMLNVRSPDAFFTGPSAIESVTKLRKNVLRHNTQALLNNNHDSDKKDDDADGTLEKREESKTKVSGVSATVHHKSEDALFLDDGGDDGDDDGDDDGKQVSNLLPKPLVSNIPNK